MRLWKPQSSPQRWVALALLALVLVGTALVGTRLAASLSGPPPSWPIGPGFFGALLLLIALLTAAGWLAYRLAAALTLSYALDRNGLYILSLGSRTVVPLDLVTSIDVGVRGAYLPGGVLQTVGSYWGSGSLSGGVRLQLRATRPPAECLLIYTPDTAYAISPVDPDAFVQDLEQRRNLGATKPLAATLERSRLFNYRFWSDATTCRLLLAAALINLLALALIAARYPQLAPMVEMRFDPSGEVAELRPRHQVLFLPLAAFGVSLLNLAAGLAIYDREQLGARLLQGASVIVQILFLIAVATILW